MNALVTASKVSIAEMLARRMRYGGEGWRRPSRPDIDLIAVHPTPLARGDHVTALEHGKHICEVPLADR
jgi:hypothetical protein